MSDFDRYLSDWLVEGGPHDVPGHVVETALATVTTTRRDRPLPGILGRLLSAEAPARPWARHQPLAAWVALTVLLATLLAIAAFGAVGGEGDKPTNGLLTFSRGGDIWVAAQDGSGVTQLTDTEAVETNPVWSPDGSRLAVWVTAGTTASLQILDAQGGVVRTAEAPMVTAATTSLPWFLPLYSGIAGWSPDGRTIVLPIRTSSTEGGVTTTGITELGLLDVETGEVHPLDLGSPIDSFGFDPTGSWLGLVHQPQGLDATEPGWVAVADRTGNEPRRLFEGYDIGTFSFTPDGRAVTFHVAPALLGAGDIAYVPLDGEPRLVVDGPTNDVAPAVSPDGRWLAFSRSSAVTLSMAFYPERGSSDLYVVPVEGGTPRLVGSGLYPGAIWSPDGTRLVAWSLNFERLVVVPADGNGDPAYIPTPDNVAGMSWQQVWPKR